MVNDILYKSDILFNLFSKDDFEFLQKSNKQKEELKSQIEILELKRKKIFATINDIDTKNENNKNIYTKKTERYLDNAESTIECIDKYIKNLNELVESYNDIEKDALELIMRKPSYNDANIEEIVNVIKKKIINIKEKQKIFENENEKHRIVINNFFELPNTIQSFGKNEKEEINFNPKYALNEEDEEIKDNLVLMISEKQKRVYLPYTKKEINEFLKNYPEEYKNARDVIRKEFVADISIYNKHPNLARFREAYSLSRDKEMKSSIDSLKYALSLMFRRDLNPTIIAAVKSQKQLEDYITCLENNDLESFNYFKILFQVNPI